MNSSKRAGKITPVLHFMMVQYLIPELGYPPPSPNFDEDMPVRLFRSEQRANILHIQRPSFAQERSPMSFPAVSIFAVSITRKSLFPLPSLFFGGFDGRRKSTPRAPAIFSFDNRRRC